MRAGQGLIAGAALAAVAACGGAAGSEGWAGSMDTLANGAVRVTNTGSGAWPTGGEWSLEPELVLGDVDGADATTFGSIAAVAVADDGRIYVLDRQANDVRIFTGDGSHVRTVGRQGGGPGEYMGANGLVWLAPDSLIVIDQQGNRYSILNRDGDFVRSVPRQLGFYAWSFDGGYHDGRIHESSSIQRNGDEYEPVLLRTLLVEPPREQGPGQSPVSELPASGVAVIDTVLLPVHPAPLVEGFSHRTERGSMVIGVPFAASRVYELAGDGSIWHGHGSEFRLVNSTLAGDTLREVRLSAEPTAVTTEELAEWEASSGVERFREMGGRIDMSRVPRTKPLFARITLDDAGHLWVMRPAAPGEARFAVFDPDGRFLGALGVAGISVDRWTAPVIRNGRLYLVGRDDLDVPRVYVFRIRAGGSPRG